MIVFIKENSFIAKMAAFVLHSQTMAITIGKTIHLHNATAEDFLKNESWLAHEMAHINQYKKYGFIKFLLLYFFESIKHGYAKNRFEKEANLYSILMQKTEAEFMVL